MINILKSRKYDKIKYGKVFGILYHIDFGNMIKKKKKPMPSILATYSPFSFLNFYKTMMAHAPLPTIGKGPQYISWKCIYEVLIS